MYIMLQIVLVFNSILVKFIDQRSEAQKQRLNEILWTIWFDEKICLRGSPREYDGADSTSQSFFSFPTEFVAVHLLQSFVGLY